MQTIGPTIAMLAAFVLAWFGARQLRGPERTRGVLMLLMAAVLVVNVAIWTL